MKGRHILWIANWSTCILIFFGYHPDLLLQFITFVLYVIGAIVCFIWMVGICGIIDLLTNDNINKKNTAREFLVYTYNPIYYLLYLPIDWINRKADKHLDPNKNKKNPN